MGAPADDGDRPNKIDENDSAKKVAAGERKMGRSPALGGTESLYVHPCRALVTL